MEFLLDNWVMFVVILAIGCVIGVGIYNWLMKPKSEKIKNIKEWLLYAVTCAQAELGTGTGALKLRSVYDQALKRFPWVQFIRFETFQEWVDEALEKMEDMLDNSEEARALVEHREVQIMEEENMRG